MKKLFILSVLIPALAFGQEIEQRWFTYSPMLFTPADMQIVSSTADGSDSSLLSLSPGGAIGITRGPSIQMAGNDKGSWGNYGGGSVLFTTGGVANRGLYFLTYNGTGASQRLAIPTNADADDVDLILGSSSTTAPVFTIRGQTADGDDDGQLNLCPGGACGSTRGSRLILNANEVGSGVASLYSGNVDTSSFLVLGTFANADIQLKPANVLTWSASYGGNLTQDATNGGNIVFNKAGTGLISKSDGVLRAPTSLQAALGNCTAGDVKVCTDCGATCALGSGSGRVCVCTATNTWN